MKSLSKRLTGVLLSVAGVVAVILALSSGLLIHAENHSNKLPLATDWSHKHLIYSQPRDSTRAFKLEREPRFLQQELRRQHNNRGDGWRNPIHNGKRHEMGRDWSMLLGAGATLGPANFAAKFAFDLNSAECANGTNPDYVAFNTNLSGGNAAAATGSVKINSEPAVGNTVTIGATTYTWETTAAACVGPCVIRSATVALNAAHLASAVNDTSCSATSCVNISSPNAAASATLSGTTVNLTGTVLGVGGDFAVATSNSVAMTVTAGTNGLDAAASVVAFDNLYSGCSTGSVPTTYWAYNTSGTVNTAVTVSGDGSQVAFVQLAGDGSTDLVILKWAAGEGGTYNGTTTSPAAPGTSTTTASAFVACKTGAGSCMMSIPLSNGASDSNSNAFYDYINDVMYVGDDSGAVHKFTGVFKGSPAEAGTPWPVTVNPIGQNILTSAIYDSVTGLVFVADQRAGNTDTNGGRLYSIDPSGAVAVSNQIANGSGIIEAPIVDGGAGAVYVFVPQDISMAGTAGVVQFASLFVNASSGLGEATVGSGDGATPLYAGDFDNDYYSFTGSGGSGRGNMYICGNPAGIPTLYQIPINSFVMQTGAANVGPTLATTVGPCSPQTEIFNPNATGGAADWFFVSVTTGGLTGNGCTGGAGCLMSFTLDDTGFVIPTTATAGLPSASGTSGVIVDNVVSSGTLTGASQVYFTPLGNQACTTSGGTGGCAIQASQSGLQ